MRSRRRPILVIAVIFGLAAGPAAAAGILGPAAEEDPRAYPVTGFTQWTGNASRDLKNAENGRYQFEAGTMGVVERVADRYPARYDPRRFVDGEEGFQRLLEESQVATDALLHNRPDLPYSHWGDAGHPETMPDWDGDGSYGDPDDFDADTDLTVGAARFRYPCFNDDGSTWYERADGSCRPATEPNPPVKEGLALEAVVVNARGLLLDATVWLPGEALADPACAPSDCVPAEGVSLPGVVFANGFSSRQEHYSWFAERMARQGYVVLTYDPAGQGQSEGTWADLFDGAVRGCQFSGACRDLQDMSRWFVGQPLTPAAGGTPRLVRHDPAANGANPAATVLDADRLAVAGNSMGALSTVAYLDHLARGAGADGRPLPAVMAAVSMSGAAQTAGRVPIQFQTSDYDGSPTLVGPGVMGVGLGGGGGQGIGYQEIKARYDRMRTSDGYQGPMALTILEGGVHTDHVMVPNVPRTVWATSVAASLAVDWLDCHVLGDPGACARTTANRPHLSRGFASEHDADGAGPEPSRCVAVPDRAHLNQRPAEFLQAQGGRPVYDCVA